MILHTETPCQPKLLESCCYMTYDLCRIAIWALLSVTKKKKCFLLQGKADATQCHPTGSISITNTQQLGVMGVMQNFFFTITYSIESIK